MILSFSARIIRKLQRLLLALDAENPFVTGVSMPLGKSRFVVYVASFYFILLSSSGASFPNSNG